MGLQPQQAQISEALKFRPKIWWDPVPPWLFEILDVQVIRQLGVIQLNFERTMLEQQIKTIDEVQKVIGRAGG